MELNIEPQRLGESPIYIRELDTFLWVDILNGDIFSYNGNAKMEMHVNDMITSISPYKGTEVIASLRDGIAIIDWKNKITNTLLKLDFPENIRFNDGRCDARGRFFIGTMDMNEKEPLGALYKFSGRKLERVLDNVTISNGIAWSLDSRFMYYIDSPRKSVQVFDYDLSMGRITRHLYDIDLKNYSGVPDGMAIDINNNLWVAIHGSSLISVIDPAKNEILNEVKIAAKKVTSCTFGSVNMDKLFVTSAYDGTGGIPFIIDTGSRGVELNRYIP
ncbi:SMP-30/gluconolactonase/LRE family protein [Picrophilus oshimae]|uniref:Gluconolactonase n=1 Tax=Picrophilus torridus (strain ATCC 700027 / DSM 9790 / JCM 10055 / NBRC 100828 / KAW 2/3) TaxID=1122961 RepID=Q6L0L0_PICTO|nr:SMP-30/gluconolactonase/LRE family protein [Picrophilus oshimae]AAT43492.1 gluconolactonase [Picrophilus oshimae DSM 9789]